MRVRLVYAGGEAVNMCNPHPRVRVRAERIADDGHGIAFDDERLTEYWVHDLLPGECADLEVLHTSQHRRRTWGRISARIGASSPQRARPLCPAFGQCGGCAWQHLSDVAQLEYKRDKVQAALASALEAPPEVPLPSPSVANRYRNKGKYVVARQGHEIVLGAYRPRSHDVVSTLGCQVVEEAIDVSATRLAALLTEHSYLPIYSEASNNSIGLRYVVLRSNREGEVLALLVCSSETPSLRALAKAMHKTGVAIGILRCDNDLSSGAIVTDAIHPLCGAISLSESISDVPIPLGPASFWQINRRQAALAFRDLCESLQALPPGAKIVELYCGTGAISFALAAAGYRVYAYDIDPAAIGDATRAAQRAGLSASLQFEQADARALPASSLRGADAIVVDPPRKGLGGAGIAQLVAAAAPTLAYLSCGPKSLASDLAALTRAGYQVQSIRLYDFMPGTSQVESLVILRYPQESI